jgi:hypothetical protein
MLYTCWASDQPVTGSAVSASSKKVLKIQIGREIPTSIVQPSRYPGCKTNVQRRFLVEEVDLIFVPKPEEWV